MWVDSHEIELDFEGEELPKVKVVELEEEVIRGPLKYRSEEEKKEDADSS